MSDTGKWVGMILSSVMFAFSAYMYTLTGDWVAAVFALGSVGYGLFFIGDVWQRYRGRDGSN
ncbi:MAG TPA: hypothetical protein DEO43_04790 [Halieaceae bacterium]|jgi:hypothetical protein|nr:hypothetical protein [Halieaceae bacterium]